MDALTRFARLIVLLLGGLGLLLTATACSSGEATESSIEVAGQPMEDQAGHSSQYREEGDLPQDDVTQKREISRSGSLTIKVADPLAAAAKLHELASSMDGLVTNEYLETNNEYASSQLELSVPSENLEAAMDAATKIGELQSRSISAVDLTAEVVDVDARIRTLEASIARIRALMEKTGSIADIAKVESELTTRQAELESLQSQRKSLRNLVDQARLTITLMSDSQLETGNPFWQGLLSGWRALAASATLLLTFIGAALPFLATAAIVIVPVWLLLRRGKAQHKNVPTDSAPAPDAPESADTDIEKSG